VQLRAGVALVTDDGAWLERHDVVGVVPLLPLGLETIPPVPTMPIAGTPVRRLAAFDHGRR
jgi:hypothetical protein